MAPPLVVIDTNVIVAALRSNRGASHQVLLSLGEDAYRMCVSVALLMEYEAAAMRLTRTTPLRRQDIDAILDYVCSEARHCKVHFLWRPCLRDPNDDMVLELAVSSGARYIITHNTRDFAGTERFGIEALTPREFLPMIRRRR
jgi:putative PIN family toxin of toxin-antitoxin system